MSDERTTSEPPDKATPKNPPTMAPTWEPPVCASVEQLQPEVYDLEQFQSETALEGFATPVPPTHAAASRIDSIVPVTPDEPFAFVEDLVPPHPAPARHEDQFVTRLPAESVDLHGPERADVTVERSHSARGALALSVAVVLGFGGWYLIASSVHRTPTGSSASVASSSAPGPSGAETSAGPEPSPTPQAQPVLPPSVARADVAPPAAETSEEPSPAAVSAPGRLLVRSTPSGARVFVDDKEYGVTPATIRDLALRTHRVRVIRDEYISEERRVPLTSARPAQSIAFELEEPQATATVRDLTSAPAPTETLGGALSVDSHPGGANVFIDDQPLGKTPVLLPQIGAGSHVVRLKLDAYRGWSSSVRVLPGVRSRVTASLEEEDQP